MPSNKQPILFRQDGQLRIRPASPRKKTRAEYTVRVRGHWRRPPGSRVWVPGHYASKPSGGEQYWVPGMFKTPPSSPDKPSSSSGGGGGGGGGGGASSRPRARRTAGKRKAGFSCFPSNEQLEFLEAMEAAVAETFKQKRDAVRKNAGRDAGTWWDPIYLSNYD